jgi:hypothetical protein
MVNYCIPIRQRMSPPHRPSLRVQERRAPSRQVPPPSPLFPSEGDRSRRAGFPACRCGRLSSRPLFFLQRIPHPFSHFPQVLFDVNSAQFGSARPGAPVSRPGKFVPTQERRRLACEVSPHSAPRAFHLATRRVAAFRPKPAQRSLAFRPNIPCKKKRPVFALIQCDSL